MRKISYHLLGAVLSILYACVTPASSGGLAPLQVHELGTQTVSPDGTLSGAEWIGRKRVRIHVDPGGHALQPGGAGVQVSYWKEGGAEDLEAAQLVAGTTTEFSFDLPTSERLDLCEYILYRWTVVYDNLETGTTGTYIGATRFVMPTKKLENTGKLVQALCSGPLL